MSRMRGLASFVLSLVAMGGLSAQSPLPTEAWRRLSDDFIDHFFAFNPSAATLAGVHVYDGELEDYSAAAIAKQVSFYQQFERRAAAFNPQGLSTTDAADREILLGAIRGNLLALRVIRTFQKDPDSYSSGAANSVYVIMSRKFAPADERLRSVISREKQFARLFAQARANLKSAPKIYTEIALEQLPGTIDFFEKDVPQAFSEATDASTKATFAESNAAAVKLLREYENWLKTDLLPRSNGDFRIGADAFSKKLAYEEMVT